MSEPTLGTVMQHLDRLEREVPWSGVLSIIVSHVPGLNHGRE